MSKKTPSSSRPRRGNLASQTADRLRESILRGRYPIGAPLREQELSQALGVSRIPIREALHRLEGEGIVTLRPNRGAAVAALSTDQLKEIAEACRLLEGHVLALALPALRTADLEEAEACLVSLDEIDDPAEWSRVNWRFHTILYGPAQRPLLLELLSSLRARAELVMQILVADKKRRTALNREHRAILACVRKRRSTRALTLLDEHLAGGRDKVLRLISRR